MLGHLYRRALEASGKRFFLDKTPRYHMILPELRRVFPEAHFVFLLRNPIAVLASVIDTWAPDDCVHCLRPFRHDLALAPGHIAEAIRRPDGHSAVIRYEDLAAQPAPAVARLCERLRIPFEPAMLEYGRSEAGQAAFRFGDTGTVYRKSRPVASRIARWKKTLDSPLRRAWAHGCLQSLGRRHGHRARLRFRRTVGRVSAPAGLRSGVGTGRQGRRPPKRKRIKARGSS